MEKWEQKQGETEQNFPKQSENTSKGVDCCPLEGFSSINHDGGSVLLPYQVSIELPIKGKKSRGEGLQWSIGIHPLTRMPAGRHVKLNVEAPPANLTIDSLLEARPIHPNSTLGGTIYHKNLILRF